MLKLAYLLLAALLLGIAHAGAKDNKPLTAPLPSKCSNDPCCHSAGDSELPFDQKLCCGNRQINTHKQRCNMAKLPRNAICTPGLCLTSAVKDNAFSKGKGMISGAKITRGKVSMGGAGGGPVVAQTS